jgi:hypothetical protein
MTPGVDDSAEEMTWYLAENIIKEAVFHSIVVPESCRSLITLLMLELDEGPLKDVRDRLEHLNGQNLRTEIEKITRDIMEGIEDDPIEFLKSLIPVKDSDNERYFTEIKEEWHKDWVKKLNKLT